MHILGMTLWFLELPKKLFFIKKPYSILYSVLLLSCILKISIYIFVYLIVFFPQAGAL